MISCFWVLALLVGVWGQSWPLTNVTVGASNASFVITTVSGVANVTATFAATTPFQWISIGFSTGNMASGGDGSDMFMCESDNTVGRYWVTSQSISAAGKVAVAGGSCSTSTVAGISRKTIHFERAVTATAQQRSLANSTAILLAFGNYPLVAHAPTNRVPTPVTFTAPTPAPPGQVIPGFAAGVVATPLKIGWNLVAPNSVHFAFEMQTASQLYMALGFQNPASSTKMTGDAIIAQVPSGLMATTVTYQATPNPTAGVYFTNGTASISGGVFHAEFVRTFAAPLTGSVAISNPAEVQVMVATGTSYPATHSFRTSLVLNLQTGGATQLDERSPALAPKLFAIIVLAACLVVGFIVTLGGRCTCARFFFFRRMFKDSQFLGPQTPMCFDITWGQFTLLMIYFALIIIFSRLEFGEASQPRFVRAMGWTSTLSLACASIPVSRHSVLLYAFGMSFERAIIIHRILGRFAILMVAIHFLSILAEPAYQPFTLTVPLIQPFMIDLSLGFWSFICMLVMLVTSISPIRRKFFEVFYFTHHLFIVVWILAILHNRALVHQLTLIVPLALWALDRVVRIYRGRLRRFELVSATTIGDVLRLEFKGSVATCGHAESGSYAFINVPGVSWFQWHPFSISSRGSAPNFTFHIKNMGVGTYTGALHAYFAQAQNKSGVRVNIDGPYGRSAVRFEDYESVLLLAGGIGVTPMAAILDDLYEKCKTHKPRRLEKVTFCWSVQSKDALACMEELVKKIQSNPNPVTGVEFSIQVYVTRGKEEAEWHMVGRPKFQTIFDSAGRPKDGAGKEWNVGVLACGPESMIVECQKQAMDAGFDFHKEIFSF